MGKHSGRIDCREWIDTWDDFGEPTRTLMRSVTDWSGAVYDEWLICV